MDSSGNVLIPKFVKKGASSLADVVDNIATKIDNLLKSGDNIPNFSNYDEVRKFSVKNPDADSVMLGKFGDGGPSSYVAQAGDKHSYFSVGEHWDDIKKAQGLSDAQMFDKYNVPFLDDAIQDGKTFHFSHDPRVADGALLQEYEYLLKNGYVFDEVTMTMKP